MRPSRPMAVAVLALCAALAVAIATGTAGTGRADSRAVTTCDPARTFTRMFPQLRPAAIPADAVKQLATAVIAEEELEVTPEGEQDAEENEDIPAGQTYVGQLVDHDLDLDDRPNDLTTPTDPNTVPNLRTPRFDLDNVYGAGPRQSPQLYEADGMHLRRGAPLSGAPDTGATDHPRDASGRALLGDGRDDENRIVAQLHSVLVRFHNRIVDQIRAATPRVPGPVVFELARRKALLHYQWAVLTDFLPTIVGTDTMRSVLPRLNEPQLRFLNPCRGVPVEFSVAAYRFGHSIVRPIYRLNSTVAERLPVFSRTFQDPNTHLGGFSPSPSNFAIDWSFFFPTDGVPRQIGRPQASYRPDNSLVFQLSLLPGPEVGTGPTSLAERNLLRANQLGLPSGQDVARAMGVRPLADSQILVGKAADEDGESRVITDVSPAFAGKAPLWTYVLAESVASTFRIENGRIVGAQLRPFRLGPVGGRIVAETLVGLMAVDPLSVVRVPLFRPDRDFTGPGGRFGFRDLIKAATGV